MKGLKKLSVLGALAVAGIVGLGNSSAKADFIPTLISVTPSGVDFAFTYSVVLTASESATATGNPPTVDGSGYVSNPTTTDSFFTIYDFQGFVSASGPVNWGNFSSMQGATPPGISMGSPPFQLTDSSSVPNVTFYYKGPPTTLLPTTFLVTVLGTTPLVSPGQFTTFANNSSGGIDQNVGPTLVPNSAGQVFGPAPATAWAGFVLLGLLGVGARMRKAMA